jgi:hypothetical protein
MIRKAKYILCKAFKRSTYKTDNCVRKNTSEFITSDVVKKHDRAVKYIRAAMDDVEKINSFCSRRKARIDLLDSINKCHPETKDKLVDADFRFQFNNAGKLHKASKRQMVKSAWKLLKNIREVRENHLPDLQQANQEGRIDDALGYYIKAVNTILNIQGTAKVELQEELKTVVEESSNTFKGKLLQRGLVAIKGRNLNA